MGHLANTRPDFVSILLLLKFTWFKMTKWYRPKMEHLFLSCLIFTIRLSFEFSHTCQWPILISVTAFLPCSKIEPVAIAVHPSFVNIMNQVYLDSSHMYMYILCAWIRSILNSVTAFPSLHIFTLCAFCEQVSNVSSCVFLWAILVCVENRDQTRQN